MRNITLRLPDETIEELENEADEHDVSRSEYLRNLVATRHEHDTMEAEHARRIEELKHENDRLHRERRQLLAERDEKKELARWAEDQRTVARRHRSRPVWRRAWTWVFGDSDDASKGEA